MSAGPRGKILFIRGGAVGDFILALPALASLRERFPNARIEVLGYRHIAALALAGGLADDLRCLEGRGLAGFFGRGTVLDPEWSDYFCGFGLIVSYLYDPDGIFAANIARCSRAQLISGAHRPEESRLEHAARVFLEPLKRVAVFDADATPRLRILPQAFAAPGGEPWLAIHPGSGGERKNWPEAAWLELLGILATESGMRVLLVGGEAERERLPRLAAALPAARRQLALSLPLEELAGRLRTCRAFVGHDSGISHLAAAVGLPGLVLWGETNAHVWRPVSDRFRLLMSPRGLASLPVADVLASIRDLWSCADATA